VQILYGGKELKPEVKPGEEPGMPIERFKWRVYYGPQGLAVNPCDPGPFALVFDTPAGNVTGTDFAHPPYPQNMGLDFDHEGHIRKNQLQYHGEQCSINNSVDEKALPTPPTYDCGNTLVIDFEKDAQFDDPEMRCEDGFRYRRGWTVEY
jgi:hypothetical protein